MSATNRLNPDVHVEVLRGAPKVVRENQIRQKVVEIPETEVCHIVQPGRKIHEHTIEKVPATHWKDVVDYEQPQGPLELLKTRYKEKKIVKEVEQLIEIPREVEEIVYVDEPIYEIVEVPEYYPTVVSRRVEPRVNESKIKVVEDICWIPHVVYDVTKDSKARSNKQSFSSFQPLVEGREKPCDKSYMHETCQITTSLDNEFSDPIKQTVTHLAISPRQTPRPNFGWSSRI